MDLRELEYKLTGQGSSKLKKQMFDIEVQRARESIKKAKSPEDRARYAKFEQLARDKYGKYSGKEFRS